MDVKSYHASKDGGGSLKGTYINKPLNEIHMLDDTGLSRNAIFTLANSDTRIKHAELESNAGIVQC